MLGEQVDLKLFNTGEFFDIDFADDGDFATTDGLNTSLIVSFLTDKRADASEINNPRYRRGWWGNLFQLDSTFPEIGSKVWLLDQSANQQDSVNNAIAYAQDAYAWLLTLNYADKVEVTATSNFDTININVKIIKNNDVISEQIYNLWQNTVREIISG